MLYEIAFGREAQRELINGMSEANSLPEPPGKLQHSIHCLISNLQYNILSGQTLRSSSVSAISL